MAVRPGKASDHLPLNHCFLSLNFNGKVGILLLNEIQSSLLYFLTTFYARETV